MERISDISERNRLRAQWRYHHSSRLTLLSMFSFFLANPLAERRGRAFSHQTGRKTVSPLSSLHLPRSLAPSLFLSLSLYRLLHLSPSLSWLLTSGRYHLSFCQLGDFNLLSFCAITGPRGPRKIVFNCDWLLSGGGRPPPFVPRFLHIPNCARGASRLESRPDEIIPVTRRLAFNAKNIVAISYVYVCSIETRINCVPGRVVALIVRIVGFSCIGIAKDQTTEK